MKMEQKHTEGEMQIMEYIDVARIDIDPEHNILFFGDNAENNALRMLKCWNSHDDLLARLKAYMAHFGNDEESDAEMKRWLDSEWIPAVEEILAKA